MGRMCLIFLMLLLSGCSPIKCVDGITYVNINPFGYGDVYQKGYTECKEIKG